MVGRARFELAKPPVPQTGALTRLRHRPKRAQYIQPGVAQARAPGTGSGRGGRRLRPAHGERGRATSRSLSAGTGEDTCGRPATLLAPLAEYRWMSCGATLSSSVGPSGRVALGPRWVLGDPMGSLHRRPERRCTAPQYRYRLPIRVAQARTSVRSSISSTWPSMITNANGERSSSTHTLRRPSRASERPLIVSRPW